MFGQIMVITHHSDHKCAMAETDQELVGCGGGGRH